VRRTGVAVSAEDTRAEEAVARQGMSRAALAYLDDLEAAPQVALARLRQALRSRLDDAGGAVDAPIEPVLRQLRRDLIGVETAELSRQYREGSIGAGTWRQLQRRLDLEDGSLDG
jgi:CPA1 family monovalent cation:H+ antiporter